MKKESSIFGKRQIEEIETKIEALVQTEKRANNYEPMSEKALIDIEISKMLPDLLRAEYAQDKEKVAYFFAQIFILLSKEGIRLEGGIKTEKEQEDTKSSEVAFSFFGDKNTQELKAILEQSARQILTNGYSPFLFLVEAIKEKENALIVKDWNWGEKTTFAEEGEYSDEKGATSEDEAEDIFWESRERVRGIKIEIDGIDLINGVYVVGYYVNFDDGRGKFYHEYGVKQVSKVDFENAKISK